MISGLHHISIICSKEETVTFYKGLGFAEVSREVRPAAHDVLVFLTGYGITLEMYIDATHPIRPDAPEARGLRHIGLRVDDLDATLAALAHLSPTPIRKTPYGRCAFLRDPDGLPIELHE